MSFCARGCGTPADDSFYLCPDCWARVSPILKREVIWAYADLIRKGTPRARDSYEYAVALCLQRDRREKLTAGQHV